MKKDVIPSIIFGLCSILLFTNCPGDPVDDGPTLTVTPSTITLEADGSGKTISVTSNTSWTVRADDSWVKYSPTGGTGGSSITVSASVNTGDERPSKLILSDKTGRATAEVTITQKKGDSPTPTPTPTQDPTLTVNPSSLSFSSSAGSNTFVIESNTSWTVSSDQTWCTINTSSGSNNATITVNVIENTSTSARNATITVSPDKASSVQISISQSGANPTLQVNKSELPFNAAGGNGTFSITSNTNWSITSDQDWCILSTSTGSNNVTITVTILENTSRVSRSAVITVKASDIVLTIAVTQEGSTPAERERTFTVGGVQFKMIRVDGGTFTMGATSEQSDDAWDDEKPTHQVTLSSYYIGETEVTDELWEAVMNTNPSSSKSPKQGVSWEDCQDFITKLNSLTGENFRLPTEAEWEFAARGGNKSRGYKYAGSDNVDDVAWCPKNTYDPHPVATKQPNELELYDMSGNVREWCNDWYGSYSSTAQTNPTGPTSGSYRVFRGGSFEYYDNERKYTSDLYTNDCRISRRQYSIISSHGYDQGFRLAL